MSKQVEWSAFYGEGDIVCECDQCSVEERFDFDDNYPDYKSAQDKLHKMGWLSVKINNQWHDFCCEECRNKYIKSHT